MRVQSGPSLPDSLPATLHATCLARGAHAVLLVGASGSGKSTLALQLAALGAGLISDDLVKLDDRAGQIWASRPDRVSGPMQIEARGFGILSCRAAPPSPVSLIVDLDHTETARLPDARFARIGGLAVRISHKVDSPAFPAMLWHYLESLGVG